jgi:hypothetical protein
MHRLIKVHIKVPDGSSRIRLALLADPRRNTSKEFFEAFGSRNKATTCCSFVAAWFMKWKQSCNTERFNARQILGLLWLANRISRL